MKECPNCKNNCDDQAAQCPKCKVIFDPNDPTRFSVPVKKKKGCLLVILIIVVLAIVIAIIGSLGKKDEPVLGDKNTTSQQQDASTAPSKDETKNDEKTSFAIGEPALLNDVQTTLVAVSESTGSEYNKPTEGNVFLLCEFTIENNSDSELNISSLMCFNGYIDAFAVSLSIPALIENTEKPQLDGTIAAGKKMNGMVGFEVTKDWKVAEIIFKPDVFSGKEITFKTTK